MANDGKEWEENARRLLRVALARHGMSQIDLAKRLTESGEDVSVASLRNKLSRGTFTAAFLLRCFHVLGQRSIILDEAHHPHAQGRAAPPG